MSTSEENYRENQEIEEDGEEMEEDESDDTDDEQSTEDKNHDTPRVHLPHQPLEDGEELVMDDQAYLVYHQVNILS